MKNGVVTYQNDQPVTFHVKTAGGSHSGTSTSGDFKIKIKDILNQFPITVVGNPIATIVGDTFAGDPNHKLKSNGGKCIAATPQAGANGKLYFCPLQ